MRIRHHIKQHLVPTKHNGFVPKLLHEKQVLGMLIVGLAVFSFAQVVRFNGYFTFTADVYPATIVSLTNHDREASDLTPLTLNSTLSKAAALKAEDMATKGYFAHTSPDGHTPWYWFAQAGYSFIYAGENLAVNFDNSNTVETAWLNSPTHRENIMNKNYTEMGVATATGFYNGHSTTFVVELFGMPAVARTGTPAVLPAAQAAGQQTASNVTPAEPQTTPSKTAALPAVSPKVAGESVTAAPSATITSPTTTSNLKVLEETPTYTMVQNTDQTLQPGDPAMQPDPTIPWYKNILSHSTRIAGLIIQTILILAIITTAGMIAREYEKHHFRHMAYGTLIAVIMFTALFVGKLGFFSPDRQAASAGDVVFATQN